MDLKLSMSINIVLLVACSRNLTYFSYKGANVTQCCPGFLYSYFIFLLLSYGQLLFYEQFITTKLLKYITTTSSITNTKVYTDAV